MCNLNLIMKKYQTKLKMRNVVQNQSVIFQSAKVVQVRENEDLFQIEADPYRHVTLKERHDSDRIILLSKTLLGHSVKLEWNEDLRIKWS